MLADGGAVEDDLSEVVQRVDGAAALPYWYYCLDSLRELGAVCYVLRQDAHVIARLAPGPRPFSLTVGSARAHRRYQLSRFTYLRRDSDGFVVESPLTGAQLELLDGSAFQMVATLAHPTTLGRLVAAARRGGASPAAARLFVALLQGAGMLADADGTASGWDFGDLVFHAGGRKERRDLHALDQPGSPTRPPPAIKPVMSTRVTPLTRPDLRTLGARDMPFTRVIEARRSQRRYGAAPLTLHQLGEFLFRVARVRRVFGRAGKGQLTSRPYPSGGARYGLELYPVVAACRGAPPGMYHYDPLRHRLEGLEAPRPDVDTLVRFASAAAGGSVRPQVLIVIAARFRRVTSKYRAMAYALILKEVGVLLQSMYLVATAMGLAPCALGAGDPERFARLIGADFHEETSVGEFLLGSGRARHAS
jgi:SagB-type dehydrogenase family enzyme